MKAMVLEGRSPIEAAPLKLADLPTPAPEEGQILVKVSVCGACHTDLDEIEGRLNPSEFPMVLGHQVVGTVEDGGEAANRFDIGDRVGITWLYSACGTCRFCLAGNENLCDQARWTGKDACGGYAEYMVISEDFAHRIPERFSDLQAAPLLCAGVIGYRAVSLAGITDGQTIGLFGFGASAHIVIQIVRHKFPSSPVYVFTRGAEHKELAVSLGASWAGSPGEQPPERIARAIDFTPVGESVRDALAVMDKGGRLVINAIRKSTAVPELDYAGHLWLEKEIKSVANVTRRDAEQFLLLAAQVPIACHVQQFDLTQANEALMSLKQARIRGAAVLRVAQ